MRNILFVAAALLALAMPGAAQVPSRPSPHKPSPHPAPPRKGRATLTLDGEWHFLPDPAGAGEARAWQKSIPSGAHTTTVPALWSAIAPGYKGAAWYWREFEIPASWRGQTLRMVFGAVAERARVWLDGAPLGDHAGGVTPFEYNVTAACKPGVKHLLAVRVDGAAAAGAGIWQDVALLSHDEAYISACLPTADGLGNVSAAVTLLNLSKISADAALDGRLVRAGLSGTVKEVTTTGQILAITPGRNVTTMLLSVRRRDMVEWSPQTPVVYSLKLAFRQEQDILDTLECPIGFREIGLRDGALLLNGNPIALKSAASRPPFSFQVDTPEGLDFARGLLRSEKDRNVNVIYLQAPAPAVLTLADELGLLVVEGPRAQDAGPLGATEVRELVLRDYAHPSIIAWDLGDVDAAAAQGIRALDPTRLVFAGAAGARKAWAPGSTDDAPVPVPAGLFP